MRQRESESHANSIDAFRRVPRQADPRARSSPLHARSWLGSCEARRSCTGDVAMDYTASGATGFVLYCGPASRNYTTRIDVGNAETYAIGTLPVGATSFCAVTAYDSGKVESDYSNELTVLFRPPLP